MFLYSTVSTLNPANEVYLLNNNNSPLKYQDNTIIVVNYMEARKGKTWIYLNEDHQIEW